MPLPQYPAGSVQNQFDWDVAVITLVDSPGVQLGWLGISNNCSLNPYQVATIGYPGELGLGVEDLYPGE